MQRSQSTGHASPPAAANNRQQLHDYAMNGGGSLQSRSDHGSRPPPPPLHDYGTPGVPNGNLRSRSDHGFRATPPPPPPRPSAQLRTSSLSALPSQRPPPPPSRSSFQQQQQQMPQQRPPPPPRPQQPKRPVVSYSTPEPMGQVDTAAYGGYVKQRTPSSTTTDDPGAKAKASKATTKRFQYKHNTLVGSFLILTAAVILSSHESTVPTILFLVSALLIYALDMANSTDAILFAIWISVPVLSLASGWMWLMEEDDDDDDSDDSAFIVPRILFHTGMVAFFWIASACLLTLQFADFLRSYHALSRQLEACLHATLPPIAATILCQAAVQQLHVYYGPDVASTAAPHIMAVLLWLACMILGSCRSSFPPPPKKEGSDTTTTTTPVNGEPVDNSYKDDDEDKDNSKELRGNFILSHTVAQTHIALLLMVPPCMHLLTFWQRLLGRLAFFDDWFDWFLALGIPYLLMTSMGIIHQQKLVGDSPYIKLPQFRQSKIMPMVMLILVSLAIQQRYLIPFAHEYSYHYSGTKQSSWMLTLYWTSATLTLQFTCWFWGRTTTQGEPLLGEYHEDILQLLLALLGMTLGKGLGMDWNFIPLPVLAFLGLSLWLTSRLLRYLTIFLFVVFATSFVTFTYRFAGIDHTLYLPFPHLRGLSLVWFAMVIMASAILIGLVAGLAVRAPGGLLHNWLKRLDVTGVLLIAHVLLLTNLEIGLLKRESTWKQLIGVYELQDASTADVIYTTWLAYLSSVTLVCVSSFMQKFNMIRPWSSWIAIALAIGKAYAIYLDDLHFQKGMHALGASDVFLDSVLSSTALVTIIAPHAFLEPVHLKSSTRYKQSLKGGPELSGKVRRTMFLYSCFILPTAVLLAVFSVLEPLLDAFLGDLDFSDGAAVLLILGSSAAVWGLALLGMLNRYLPDGGAEMWKRFSGLVFLIGVMLCGAVPFFGTEFTINTSNPYKYAAISPLAKDIARRRQSRTGGWGVLAILIATILAMLGPLELRPRRNNQKSGTKDRFLLFRVTIFSLIFGGGIAWFVTVQLMSEAEFVHLLFTTVSAMMMAFLCTLVTVFGYFVELKNFEEVEQLGNATVLAFPIFFAVTVAPSVLKVSSSTVGSLSAYGVVCGLSFWTLVFSLQQRPTKDVRVRGLSNAFCLAAWSCFVLVLYGRFGVAGLDENLDAVTVMGLSSSLVGTVAISPILFLLQGEAPPKGAGRKLSGGRKAAKFWCGIPLFQLRKSNQFMPLCIGTSGTWLLASLYANLLRGSSYLSFLGGSVIRSHEDLLSLTFGTTGSDQNGNADLAQLAEQTLVWSQGLQSSAKLAGSGFWTAPSTMGPLLHLLGICLTVPTLYLALERWWFPYQRRTTAGVMQAYTPFVPSGLVLTCAALNVVPLLLARGIPTLQATAWMHLGLGLVQATVQLYTAHNSRMEI